jgi:hypothetical protein
VNQQFTLDRESFEQLLAAVSLFQSLQQAAVSKTAGNAPSLLQYSLETLRAADSGTLDLQSALERMAGLALQIVDGDGAVVWLFTSESLICRAAVGANFDDDHIRTALRSRLQSAGAFGINSPSTLDLTRTLANYSGALGSSLAIALLPGGRIAGALAVFSDPSRTFTERNYANLRLLAGLAQYVLAKWVAGQEQDSLDASAGRNLDRNALLATHVASSMERSAGPPLISRAPHPEPMRREQVAGLDLPAVGARVAPDGGINDHPQIETDRQSVSNSTAQDGLDVNSSWDNPLEPPARKSSPGGAHQSSLALQRWEQWKKRFKSRRDGRVVTAVLEGPQSMRRLSAAVDAAKNILRRARSVRVNWVVIRQAAPAFAILAVMSFFVGLLTGGRQPLADGSLNSVAQAAAEPAPNNSITNVSQKAPAILVPMKSTAVPFQTSHLQITDRETAAIIAELSKYEVRNLRRLANYGDDHAALELGMLYELGRGFPQSCSKAATWVTKAAQDGNPAAEYNLGLRYRDGDGVGVDIQQAEKWLRKAAAHKNSNAQRVLADLSSSSIQALSQPAR